MAWRRTAGRRGAGEDSALRPIPRRLTRHVLTRAPRIPSRSRTTYPGPVGDLDSARAFALSLPGATEAPHFDMSSFRVRGKIFATVPPDDEYLHVFVDEGEVHAAVAEDPAAFEPLLWGQQLRGLRIRIAAAPDHRIAELLEESWRRRAPARLAAERDAERGSPG